MVDDNSFFINYNLQRIWLEIKCPKIRSFTCCPILSIWDSRCVTIRPTWVKRFELTNTCLISKINPRDLPPLPIHLQKNKNRQEINLWSNRVCLRTRKKTWIRNKLMKLTFGLNFCRDFQRNISSSVTNIKSTCWR